MPEWSSGTRGAGCDTGLLARLSTGILAPLIAIAAVGILCASASAAGPPWLYWSNIDDAKPRSISRADLGGGSRIQDLVKAPADPYGLSLNTANVFWAEYFGGTIGRADLTGAAANPRFITGASRPTDVYVSERYVYWANNSTGTIGRANLDGSGVNQKFITGIQNIVSLWVSPTHVYWGSGGTGFLFWKKNAAIGRATLDGRDKNGKFITGKAVRGPGTLVADSNYLYWTNASGSPTIARAKLDGSGARDFITAGPKGSTPYGLAVTGDRIYWTLYGSNRIGRADLGGTVVDPNFITGPSSKRKGPGSVAVTENRLAVTVGGSGSGEVRSDPVGIRCPGDCGEDFADGTLVRLSAVSSDNSRFSGWGGACESAGRSPNCTVTMKKAETVTAAFDLLPPASHQLTVTRSGAGSGVVASTPAGINCGTDCVQGFTEGTSVALRPTPGDGSVFAGWSGDCSRAGSCAVQMSQARNVDARFEPLPPTSFQLRVSNLGTGLGRVISDPAGIDCGEDCVQGFPRETVVTLETAPSDRSRFDGWGGACQGTGACSVTMDRLREVTASFSHVPPERFDLEVQRTGSGGGVIISEPAGINCGPDCLQAFTAGSTVTLKARPDDESSFTGWGGACSGSQESCTVAMDEAKLVTAGFEQLSPSSKLLAVSTTGTGAGTITSTPAGISCGSDCRQGFPEGTAVTLTSAPDDNSSFAGWGGACSGSQESCTVTMDDARTVAAAFNTLPADAFLLTIDATNTGFGRVTSSPAGIDCGSDCRQRFAADSTVILTEEPRPDGTFSGWKGACSGSASTCPVRLTRELTVGALFSANNRFVIASTRRSTTTIKTKVQVPGAGRMTQVGKRPATSGLETTACRGSRKLPGPGSYTLTCRLNRAAVRRLRNHSLRVTLATTYDPADSGALRTIYRQVKVARSGNPSYRG